MRLYNAGKRERRTAAGIFFLYRQRGGRRNRRDRHAIQTPPARSDLSPRKILTGRAAGAAIPLQAAEHCRKLQTMPGECCRQRGRGKTKHICPAREKKIERAAGISDTGAPISGSQYPRATPYTPKNERDSNGGEGRQKSTARLRMRGGTS